MSGSFSVSINPNDIAASIASVDAIVQKVVSGVEGELASTGMKTVESAKGKCPVQTGKLRDSIASIEANDGKIYSSEVGSSLFYAIFVELGHRKKGHSGIVNPQPFLVPAFEENYPELIGAFEKLVGG